MFRPADEFYAHVDGCSECNHNAPYLCQEGERLLKKKMGEALLSGLQKDKEMIFELRKREGV